MGLGASSGRVKGWGPPRSKGDDTSRETKDVVLSLDVVTNPYSFWGDTSPDSLCRDPCP